MTTNSAQARQEPPPLRDYQQRGVEAIEQLIMSGRRRVLAIAPTGAGKGTMAAHMLARTALHGGTALFCVHRREILYDIAERLRALGVEPGLLHSDKPDRTLPVQLCSIQALIHDRKRHEVDLLIIDEAHHYAAEEWSSVLKHVRPYATVGFTATPQRSDGRSLGDVFDVMVDVVSYSELLDRGHIVPCKVLRPEAPLGVDLAQDATAALMKHAPGSQAFVFVRSLPHARETLKRMTRAGLRAAIVDTNTSESDRARALDGMRARELDAIVNYYTMTEGIDVPSVSTIVLARSCVHEGSYMQMVGRALRAYPGKREALVLDLCGTSYLHGLPLTNRVYSLKDKGMSRAGDVTEHKARALPDPSHVLNVELVEATDEQQRRWGRRRIDWGKAGLGQRTDKEVAVSVGVSAQLVAKMRKMRGLKPFQGTSRPKLTVDWVALGIGTRPDVEIAREVGCNEDTVRKTRKRLGLDRTTRGRGVRLAIDWDNEPLGAVPDSLLAAKHRVSSSTVHRERGLRGIGAYQRPVAYGRNAGKQIDWDAQPLGKATDTEIARDLGVHKKTVMKERQRRGIAAHTPSLSHRKGPHVDWSMVTDLGKRSDYAISKRLGVAIYRVKAAREDRGIPIYQWKRELTSTGIDWDAVPYGELSDSKLAKDLGVATSCVRRHRIRRGILLPASSAARK